MTGSRELLALQRLDTAADQVRHRRSALPERQQLRAIESQLEDLEREHREATERRHALELQQRRLDDEIAGIEAKRSDVDRKLRVGTVPRELQALSDEATALARRQSDLEDDVLEVMEQAEPLDHQLGRLETERARLDAEAVLARSALAEAEVATDRELEGLAAGRAAVLEHIDAGPLAEYERLRSRLGGIAVSELIGGKCTGCHLALPAVEVDRIRHESPDAIVYCDCGRLLVVG